MKLDLNKLDKNNKRPLSKNTIISSGYGIVLILHRVLRFKNVKMHSVAYALITIGYGLENYPIINQMKMKTTMRRLLILQIGLN